MKIQIQPFNWENLLGHSNKEESLLELLKDCQLIDMSIDEKTGKHKFIDWKPLKKPNELHYG